MNQLLLFSVTVDLMDLEGDMKNLPAHRDEYAHQFMSDRGTYVLVKVESKKCTTYHHCLQSSPLSPSPLSSSMVMPVSGLVICYHSYPR